MDRGTWWAIVYRVAKSQTCLKQLSRQARATSCLSRNEGNSEENRDRREIQWCPPLCDPIDYTVHGILQARILEWVTFPFSKGSSQPRDWNQVFLSVGGFFTSWATREFQECWKSSLFPWLEWSLPWWPPHLFSGHIPLCSLYITGFGNFCQFQEKATLFSTQVTLFLLFPFLQCSPGLFLHFQISSSAPSPQRLSSLSSTDKTHSTCAHSLACEFPEVSGLTWLV